MQFGRIDANAYTLDFQYPLTAIQVMVMVVMRIVMLTECVTEHDGNGGDDDEGGMKME